jgi:hypothetical protein
MSIHTSLAGNGHMLRAHLAQNTDGNTRAGEGVSHDKVFMDAHLATHVAHLVLEALAQGLVKVSQDTPYTIIPI